MNDADTFQYFWLALVSVIGLGNLAWAINDLRSGSARMNWYGSRVQRAKEPFEFWMAIGSKVLGVIVSAFMIWFGSGMLHQ